MLDESFQREGEEAVHGVVDEAIGLSRFSAQEMRQRVVPRHVLAPDDGIADDGDLLRVGEFAQPALVEPIVFAELIRDAVIGSRVESLQTPPQPRGGEHERCHDGQNSQPLPGVEAHFIDAEGRLSRHGMRRA